MTVKQKTVAALQALQKRAESLSGDSEDFARFKDDLAGWIGFRGAAEAAPVVSGGAKGFGTLLRNSAIALGKGKPGVTPESAWGAAKAAYKNPGVIAKSVNKGGKFLSKAMLYKALIDAFIGLKKSSKIQGLLRDVM